MSRSRSRSQFHSLRSFIDFDPLLVFMYSVTVAVSRSHSDHIDPLLFSMNSVMATVHIHSVTDTLSWSRCHGHGVTVSIKLFIQNNIGSKAMKDLNVTMTP